MLKLFFFLGCFFFASTKKFDMFINNKKKEYFITYVIEWEVKVYNIKYNHNFLCALCATNIDKWKKNK